MIVAISADSRFSSQVGIGLSGHDFEGTILIKVRISPSVAGSNEAKDGISHKENGELVSVSKQYLD
jgi:hypothetical protein